jgi:hypothetical protein
MNALGLIVPRWRQSKLDRDLVGECVDRQQIALVDIPAISGIGINVVRRVVLP